MNKQPSEPVEPPKEEPKDVLSVGIVERLEEGKSEVKEPRKKTSLFA
jgi:hypothetical protein